MSNQLMTDQELIHADIAEIRKAARAARDFGTPDDYANGMEAVANALARLAPAKSEEPAAPPPGVEEDKRGPWSICSRCGGEDPTCYIHGEPGVEEDKPLTCPPDKCNCFGPSMTPCSVHQYKPAATGEGLEPTREQREAAQRLHSVLAHCRGTDERVGVIARVFATRDAVATGITMQRERSAGLAARDGERVRLRWEVRYASGELVAAFHNEGYAKAFKSQSHLWHIVDTQPPAPEVRP